MLTATTIRHGVTLFTGKVASPEIRENAIDWWYERVPAAARRLPMVLSGGRSYTAMELRAEMEKGTPMGKRFEQWLAGYRDRGSKRYRCLRGTGEMAELPIPGVYGGYRKDKIYGRLDCKSGKRTKPENRVFFLTVQDAWDAGYRACKNCKPDRGGYFRD